SAQPPMMMVVQHPQTTQLHVGTTPSTAFAPSTGSYAYSSNVAPQQQPMYQQGSNPANQLPTTGTAPNQGSNTAVGASASMGLRPATRTEPRKIREGVECATGPALDDETPRKPAHGSTAIGASSAAGSGGVGEVDTTTLLLSTREHSAKHIRSHPAMVKRVRA